VGSPSPEEQLAFLARIQRLFAEGDFAATYKFALLIAIADLAVELGADDGSELSLDQQTLGRKFIDLYWQQAAPYGVGDGASSVLAQNAGEQAAVVKAIVEFRRAYPNSTRQSAAAQPGYVELVRSVAATVFAQPVKYLQNLGGQTDQFLFERMRGAIRLKPGIAFSLRRFQILIQQLARKSWIDHIKGNRRNLAVLGETSDLESFLFDTPRSTLEIIRRGLTQLTGPKCFYCRMTLREADVDHFIPFSLYPRDLSHNFVLSDPRCNRSKSTSDTTFCLTKGLTKVISRSIVASDRFMAAIWSVSVRLRISKVCRSRAAISGSSNTSFENSIGRSFASARSLAACAERASHFSLASW
jgi:hypothetical protein